MGIGSSSAPAAIDARNRFAPRQRTAKWRRAAVWMGRDLVAARILRGSPRSAMGCRRHAEQQRCLLQQIQYRASRHRSRRAFEQRFRQHDPDGGARSASPPAGARRLRQQDLLHIDAGRQRWGKRRCHMLRKPLIACENPGSPRQKTGLRKRYTRPGHSLAWASDPR